MKKLNDEMVQSIVDYLKTNCYGKNNAKIVSKIADAIGEELEWNDTTGGFIRNAIKKILKTTTLPIGSCNKGYYIISNHAEYLEVQSDLDRRIDGIFERKAQIENNFQYNRFV